MGRVLLVGLDASLQESLLADAAWLGSRRIESAASAREAVELLQGGEPLDLVIIGPEIPDPVRTLQRIGSLATDASAAILHAPHEAELIQNALTFAPFLPEEVFHRSVAELPTAEELADWGERAGKRRRQHRQVLEANRQLAEGPVVRPLTSGVYLDRLLDRAPIGICALDESLRIVSWNRAAQDLFGRAEREVLGAPFARFVRSSSAVDLADVLRRGTDLPIVVEPETGGRPADRQLELIATPATTERSIPGTLVLLIDVTERLRGERERERLMALQTDLLARETSARAEAEAALRWRDDFLSVAAHELRTPLTSIKGFAQLISRWLDREPPELDLARERLSDLAVQVERYERLVSDLLDVSRIQQGRLSISPRPMNLTELVEVVCRRFEHAADRSEQHRLALDLAAPVEGVWDADRLEQVVVNLISNALRFSPDGGTVAVSMRANEGRVELAVSDEGLGIPEEEFESLFRPFERATTGNGVLGTGLGLYISAQIVEMHGGRVRVQSRVGEGSTFTVELPRSRPEAPAEDPPTEPEGAS